MYLIHVCHSSIKIATQFNARPLAVIKWQKGFENSLKHFKVRKKVWKLLPY